VIPRGGSGVPTGRRDLLRRTLPFAAITALAFATVPLSTEKHDSAALYAAAGVTALIVVSIALLPWDRLPRWARLVLPLLGLLLVALLREAEGGMASGYGALVLVPVMWVALYGNSRELLITIAGVAVTLALPIVVDGLPDYPDTEWRRAIILTALAAFVGGVTQSLVTEVRSRAVEAEQRARREAEQEEYMRAVMDSAAEGIVAVDRDGIATFANPAAARMFGYSVEEIVGRRMHDLVHHSRADGSPYPADECPVFQAVRTGVPRTVSDEVYWRSDGTSFPVEYRVTAMSVDGEATGAVNTFTDISERLAVERMKDEFVSVVSHELRTPLTSIRGSLGLMEGGVLGELTPEAQNMLGIAITNADRLVRLINDILDAERIESGKAPMEMRQTDLALLMTRTADLLEPAAKEARVELDIEPTRARLLADPDRIIQTLVNLVGNAVKFSEDGSAVRVRAEVEERRVVVRVLDRGAGIPADVRDTIFDRFAQVEGGSTRAKGGSGLGLAIARGIVEQHGGRIWVEDRAGGGSVFAFDLPLARAAADHARADGAPIDALIVEDDLDLADVLATRLERDGLSAVGVPSLAAARELLAEELPRLLVLDLALPDADSRTLAGWLRTDERLRAVRVIVYTALDLPPAELADLREFGEVIQKGRVNVEDFSLRVVEAIGAGADQVPQART
jgi:PAS domain S-box-containing protein